MGTRHETNGNGRESSSTRRIAARLAELARKREQCDAEVVRRAATKRAAGDSLNRTEAAQLRRWQDIADEERFYDYCRRIPQRAWRVLCAKQTKQLNDQADRYGLPLGGPFVDLADLVPALFAFLADNARRLASPESDDPLLAGASSPALEEYRRERTLISRLERQRMEKTLFDRVELHEFMANLVEMLRSAGDTLQRQYGPAAADVLNETIDEFGRRVDESFTMSDDTVE